MPRSNLRRQAGKKPAGERHQRPPSATTTAPHPDRPGVAAPRRLGDRRAPGRANPTSPTENHVGLAPVAPARASPTGASWSRGSIRRPVPGATPGATAGWCCASMMSPLSNSTASTPTRCTTTPLPALCGRTFFKQPRPATTQLAEVGFLLRNGEFIPAARSRATPFPPPGPSPHGGHAGLFVDDRGAWRRSATSGIRKGFCASAASRGCSRGCARRRSRGRRRPSATTAPRPVSSPSWRRASARPGTKPTSSLPPRRRCPRTASMDGVHYHALVVKTDGSPLEQARSFARAAEGRLRRFSALRPRIISTNG